MASAKGQGPARLASGDSPGRKSRNDESKEGYSLSSNPQYSSFKKSQENGADDSKEFGNAKKSNAQSQDDQLYAHQSSDPQYTILSDEDQPPAANHSKTSSK